jgi:hypothetical protein
MYEFEGLLFSDVNCFDCMLDAWDAEARTKLERIWDAFESPEHINNHSDSAPSKRILDVFGGQYNKVKHGPLIAEAIGVSRLREQCKQFHFWLSHIESWGRSQLLALNVNCP